MKLKPVALFSLILIFVLSCNHPSNTNETLNKKMDSLSNQIEALQNAINAKSSKDTSQIVLQKNLPTQKEVIQTPTPNPEVKNHNPVPEVKTTKPVETPTPKPGNETNDVSEFYYYNGNTKTKSVEITAWKDSRRKVIFYNLKGEVTYTCEDVKMSYSISTTLKKFHSNGAVSNIEVHTNPGASMYWYVSSISFDENNVPLWKTDTQYPIESIAEAGGDKFYWDAKTNAWIKQQTVEEQNYPH